MRVIRRTRPSRVGCGSSVARRRLLHASGSTEETTTSESSLPSLMLLVRLNQQRVPLTQIGSPAHAWSQKQEQESKDGDGIQSRELAGSSARG
jgi:hypothetical protein